MQKGGGYGTVDYRVVAHPSTSTAWRRLTSLFGWEAVLLTQYGRIHQPSGHTLPSSSPPPPGDPSCECSGMTISLHPPQRRGWRRAQMANDGGGLEAPSPWRVKWRAGRCGDGCFFIVCKCELLCCCVVCLGGRLLKIGLSLSFSPRMCSWR